MTVTKEMQDKINDWFGSSCKHEVIESDDNCSMVLVKTEGKYPEYSLARLLNFGGRIEISVDFAVDSVNIVHLGNLAELIRKCRQLA
jgi:hypothetical protein